MISIIITLEIIATAAIVYGFTQEEKIVQFEDQVFCHLKKIVKNIIIVKNEWSPEK